MKRQTIKTTIIITVCLILTCCIFTLNSRQKANSDDDAVETKTEIPQTQSRQTTEEDPAVGISSDEYFEIVNDTIKKHSEPFGYTISRISALRQPYYSVECKATNIDTANFQDDTLKIAENIYNTLLEHEYKKPNIFLPSHDIISITFYVETNGEITMNLCIQFDLTDIDRNKSFSENLKITTTP